MDRSLIRRQLALDVHELARVRSKQAWIADRPAILIFADQQLAVVAHPAGEHHSFLGRDGRIGILHPNRTRTRVLLRNRCRREQRDGDGRDLQLVDDNLRRANPTPKCYDGCWRKQSLKFR